jgi:hypothetical protein
MAPSFSLKYKEIKTYHFDITEILLKVALNTINQTNLENWIFERILHVHILSLLHKATLVTDGLILCNIKMVRRPLQFSRGRGIPLLTSSTPPHICATPKPGPGFPHACFMVFFVFNDLRQEVVVY